MLVNIDVKSLEIVVAAYLSQDPILMEELQSGKDLHEDNRIRFGLPTRLISKVLGFRILYGGTEHSFVRDPDFTSVSTSKDYWARVIEAWYTKYKGIKKWHTQIVQEATTTGKVISPTGRIFPYTQKQGAFGPEWPITSIKNYIVQGTGADLVMIARISLFNRLKRLGLGSKLCMTVHDSIVIDCPENEWQQVAEIAKDCVKAVPMNFEKVFGKPFNLSLSAEVLYGTNLGDMKEM